MIIKDIRPLDDKTYKNEFLQSLRDYIIKP